MSRIEDLYQHDKKEQSPTASDNFIIKAAEQSCKEKIALKNRKKWLYALPTAAVVILSLSVVLNLQHENQELMTAPRLEPTATVQAPAPKSSVPLEKNKILKKESGRDNHQMNSSIERKNNVHNLNTPAPRKEKKKEASFQTAESSPLPIYEESALGAMAADTIQDVQIEQEKDNKTLARATHVPQTQNKPHTKRQKISALQAKILTLKSLIDEKQKEPAQKLLNALKAKYTVYDFSEYDAKIMKMKIE